MRSWFLPLAFVILFLVLIVRYVREPYKPLIETAKPAPSESAARQAPDGTGDGHSAGIRGEEAAPDSGAAAPSAEPGGAVPERGGAPGDGASTPSSGPFTVLLFVGSEMDDGRNIGFQNAVDEAVRYHGGRMTVLRPEAVEAGSYGVSELPAVVLLGPDGAIRETFEGKGTAVMRRLKWRLMHP